MPNVLKSSEFRETHKRIQRLKAAYLLFLVIFLFKKKTENNVFPVKIRAALNVGQYELTLVSIHYHPIFLILLSALHKNKPLNKIVNICFIPTKYLACIELFNF